MIERRDFELDPRSAGLRRDCLTGTRAYLKFLLGEADSSTQGEILDVNSAIIGKGIVPNMHVEPKEDGAEVYLTEAQFNDPVIRAEYACGQLINHWRRHGLTTADPSILAEHDEFTGMLNGIIGINPDVAPTVAVDFAAKVGFVGLLERWLDGPLDIPS